MCYFILFLRSLPLPFTSLACASKQKRKKAKKKEKEQKQNRKQKMGTEEPPECCSTLISRECLVH
jgi:hypothetical protein